MTRGGLALILGVTAIGASAQLGPAPSRSPLPTVDIEHFLPVRTRAMQAGAFEPKLRPTGVSQPFFLIGCDDDSLAWLKKNRARLIELGAFGLVVEAEDIQVYRRLEAAAAGLIVRPVAGDLIAQHLGIARYPALVTADGISP